MEELFNKPVLDQMYDFRKEDFEQTIYDNNAEIKEIESKVYEVSEKFNNFLKKVISDSKNYHAALEMFRNYELTYNDEIEFWNRTYFKLGITDREKIRNEFFNNKLEKDEDTYFNNETNDISEWVEEQKRKYTFGTKEYKELQKRYNEIGENYPNALKVFENLEPIILDKDEMKALINLREIDIEMGHMEKKLCFKLGMKEVINF